MLNTDSPRGMSAWRPPTDVIISIDPTNQVDSKRAVPRDISSSSNSSDDNSPSIRFGGRFAVARGGVNSAAQFVINRLDPINSRMSKQAIQDNNDHKASVPESKADASNQSLSPKGTADSSPSKSSHESNSSSSLKVRKSSSADEKGNPNNGDWGLRSLAVGEKSKLEVCPARLQHIFRAITKEGENTSHQGLYVRIFEIFRKLFCCGMSIRCLNEHCCPKCWPTSHKIEKLGKKMWAARACEYFAKSICCSRKKISMLECCCAPCWPEAEATAKLGKESFCTRMGSGFKRLFCLWNITSDCISDHTPTKAETISLGVAVAKSSIPWSSIATEVAFQGVELSAVQEYTGDRGIEQTHQAIELLTAMTDLRDEYNRLAQQLLEDFVENAKGAVLTAVGIYGNFKRIEAKLRKDCKMDIKAFGVPWYKITTENLFWIVLKVLDLSQSEISQFIKEEELLKSIKDRGGMPAEITKAYDEQCLQFKENANKAANKAKLLSTLQEHEKDLQTKDEALKKLAQKHDEDIATLKLQHANDLKDAARVQTELVSQLQTTLSSQLSALKSATDTQRDKLDALEKGKLEQQKQLDDQKEALAKEHTETFQALNQVENGLKELISTEAEDLNARNQALERTVVENNARILIGLKQTEIRTTQGLADLGNHVVSLVQDSVLGDETSLVPLRPMSPDNLRHSSGRSGSKSRPSSSSSKSRSGNKERTFTPDSGHSKDQKPLKPDVSSARSNRSAGYGSNMSALRPNIGKPRSAEKSVSSASQDSKRRDTSYRHPNSSLSTSTPPFDPPLGRLKHGMSVSELTNMPSNSTAVVIRDHARQSN